MANSNQASRFRLAITDPQDFFGRQELLTKIRRSPTEVRIILGGRRLGKTSLLNQIRWTLLDVRDDDPNRVLPIFFDLQQEQPNSLDNFRYLLIRRLRETIHNPEQTPSLTTELLQILRRFLRQIAGGGVRLAGITLNIANLNKEQALNHTDFAQDLTKIFRQLQQENCQGVCFLFDGAEYLVKQDWANDAWSYLRSLKDNTNVAIQPFLGLILAGYRDLKDYQQQVGSPLLNIAKVDCLKTLDKPDTKALINHRCHLESESLTPEQIEIVLTAAGGHPYLTHQVLTTIFENKYQDQPLSGKDLRKSLIRELRQRDFEGWWDKEQKEYGFSKAEQTVYLALIEVRQTTPDNLAEILEDMSVGQIEDALDVVAGAGVIRELDYETYAIGAKLFEQWVRDEKMPRSESNFQ